MESSSLRQLLASLFLTFLFSPFLSANVIFDADEIRARFETMECMITPRYTTEVESYIKKYLAYNGSQASRVMARASVYFPIYEKFLEEHDLPQDLKYLSIVESALIPNASSPAGAKGLWQFMSETGRNYCLTIDKEVDERYCPYNSTEAAMQYLAKQYQRYGSWEMALASYNCGPGTINKAMKRARSDNYWTISKYLPRETKNFVPAFLGAAYIANFYHLHDIEPEYPSLDKQVTESLKVFERLDFTTIAAISGLPLEVVAEMNPAYKKDYIPENTEGYDLILPRRVSSAMFEYLEARRPDKARNIEMPPLPELVDTASYKPEELYFNSTYVVAEGDKIGELADVFNVAPYNLKVWNKLTSYQLKKGQELTIWFPNELRHFLPKEQRIEVMPPVEVMIAPVVEAVPEEEIYERDNLPVPGEMPITIAPVVNLNENPSSLKVVNAPPAIIEVSKMEKLKSNVSDKVGKVIAPIKNIKINLPKKKEKSTVPPAPAPEKTEKPSLKANISSKAKKMVAPIKNIKINLPKKEKSTAPPAPKKAPAKPKQISDTNGHGLI